MKRFEGGGGNVDIGDELTLQLWREKAGSESAYTLRTEQTHTAGTKNAQSYAFQASPALTVSAGDVFGFYASTRIGFKMAVISDIGHTMFTVRTSSAAELRFTTPGFNASPLILIDFSKYCSMMITCYMEGIILCELKVQTVQ